MLNGMWHRIKSSKRLVETTVSGETDKQDISFVHSNENRRGRSENVRNLISRGIEISLSRERSAT